MNKKLLGLTALTALILAGCGGEDKKDDDKPSVDPTPTEVTPYVDPYLAEKEDLKTRIAALGEKIEGTFTLKKGAIYNGQELDADQTTNFVQTSDYSFSQYIGGTVKYTVGTDVAYYNVGYGNNDQIVGKWGRAYKDTEEFEAKQLVSGLKDILKPELFNYNSESKSFTFVSPALVEALSIKLGYQNLFGEFAALIDVKVEEDNSITFSLKAKAYSENYIAVVNLEHNEDARDTTVEEFMQGITEFPSSGIDPLKSQEHAFAGSYTGSVTQSTEPYKGLVSGSLLFNDYITETSYTRATAGDYTDYEDERFAMQYFLAGNSKNVKNGIYAWQAESDDEATIQKFIDDKDTDSYEFVDLSDNFGTITFWYTSGYMNPKTAIEYNISDKFFDEVVSEYGSGYRMEDGREYTNSSGKKATIGAEDFEDLASCFDLTNILDMENGYSGYDVDDWHYADLYIEYPEGEEPSESNAEAMWMMMSFHGAYVRLDDDGNVEKRYDAEETLVVKKFYDFGTTVDPFAGIKGNFVEDVSVSFEEGASIDISERNKSQLHVVVNPEKYKQDGVFTSGNEAVASVDEDGMVTAVKPGNTKVTFEVGGASNSIKINVKYVDTIITMKEEGATIKVGEYLKVSDYIDSIVYASDEVVVDPENYALSYSSSKSSVASVNSNGKVTAKAAGTATITVKRGTSTTTFVVTVEPAE